MCSAGFYWSIFSGAHPSQDVRNPDKNDIKCGFLNEFSRLRIVVDFLVEITASGL
jgi:hypothetical protein